jgi:hypothetical protein
MEWLIVVYWVYRAGNFIKYDVGWECEPAEGPEYEELMARINRFWWGGESL